MREKGNTLGVGFIVKKNKGKNGEAPLYLRITVNGKRAELSMKVYVGANKWDFGKSTYAGYSNESKRLNTQLEQIKGHVIECYHQLQARREVITIDTVKNLYLGIEKSEFTLMKLFDYHNEEMKESLRWGTLKNYFTTQKYFKRYLIKILFVRDISLSQLKYGFLTGFEKFMKESESINPDKPCNHNTIMKHIERLKKVVNLAVRNEWLEKDPFMQFKPSFIKNDIAFLNQRELVNIENKLFLISRLDYVRDLFVFSCYTGLSYSDVYALSNENIQLGIDGEKWIVTNRIKNNQQVRVPILPNAESILEKYKNNARVKITGKLLPVFSNQKMNSYLKEIADVCGIEKNLTFHVARHTFATTITLNNGVPIETVSKLLGHRSISTTQIYARVIDTKLSQDMKRLREVLPKRSY
ncbi:site-specific integrase [Carboxylicivirga marina]|uniref:Site-specific integrase n=1 Tax=Carboxylicivirga marina TaxID=2800988 RepID=A0ABS1HIZ0_9BACT|nr:site-specific integrase [Carboxylicivirga marina]MBK3517531.1 site-specific integrase [Carboxylicivirga marina]